tara:strand:+ start:66 stop:680 length:615 start_codon:yes stop_codon:yes gene_type:complete
MKVTDAKKITGSLTRTSKMPGLSYSLPAWECKTGSKLRKIKGSVCASCYALKGNYTRYKAIKAAQYVRLEALKDTKWIAAMVAQIIRQKYFRWHDAGDIQSMEHLYKIFRVCELTPETKHWMPTREAQFLSKIENPTVEVPSNLIIRMSSHMVDQPPVKFWPWTSTVISGQGVASCPAPKQNNSCGSCRQCWDRSIANVSYGKH